MEFISIDEEVSFMKRKFKVKREIEAMFMQSGYIEVEPPYFDEYEQFSILNQRVKQSSLVKVLSGQGQVSILRPDITSLLINNFVPRWEEGKKLKIFYQSTVFANDSNSASICEQKQSGVEFLGETSPKADCEVIKMALSILATYSNSYVLELGSSTFLNQLFKEAAISEQQERKLKFFLYHKDEKGLKDFVEPLPMKNSIKQLLLNILSFQGNVEEVAKKAKSFYMNEGMQQALQELEEINKYITSLGYREQVIIDLGMVTTFDYYEGIIFRGYYPTVFQPIISGGRYDALTEKLGRRIPAVGFKVDLTSLIKAIRREEE
jgi:ATP phosphoribosyltransferase regulatory subunit